MCIVIDVNTLAPVFNEECEKHSDFSPVKDWIEEGNGFLVFGGSTYKQELPHRYLRLIRQMRDGGKAVLIRDDLVDAREIQIRKLTKNTDCDDQHIIALLGIARCHLFCSNDKRAYPFVRDRSLYPQHMRRMRIYSSNRNIRLLTKCDKNTLKGIE